MPRKVFTEAEIEVPKSISEKRTIRVSAVYTIQIDMEDLPIYREAIAHGDEQFLLESVDSASSKIWSLDLEPLISVDPSADADWTGGFLERFLDEYQKRVAVLRRPHTEPEN